MLMTMLVVCCLLNTKPGMLFIVNMWTLVNQSYKLFSNIYNLGSKLKGLLECYLICYDVYPDNLYREVQYANEFLKMD